MSVSSEMVIFFFFQAEDGIRDVAVTGVQTCALPILTLTECRGWLPDGKRAAVCFSVDDVHPATSRDEFDAGGDLGRGALGHVERLLDRHPRLRVTLFVTPDWRLKRLVPTRKWLTRIPLLRERIHWAPVTPRGHFRVDRFPEFVAYLNALPRTDCAPHGLNHAHPGPRMAVEFQEQSRSECRVLLEEARQIFATAGLRHVQGFAAPAWSTPPALCEDRKSTRLNSSHGYISYAVFCLKKKKLYT